MKPSRIVLLAVAVVCAGLAAFLVTRGDRKPAEPETATVEVRQEARTQILIASKDIGVGQRLSLTDVEWSDWPEGSVRPEYITVSQNPDAIDQISGAVARFEFFAGEPIREQKLARTDQGYLSAVLSPGMRGVSVSIAPASGAGGFIIPNDHVDVVVTRSSNLGQIAETILTNVKVLAIGKRLGEVGATAGKDDDPDPQNQGFDNDTVATLELEPGQAETLVNAASIGQISLVLRSVADFAVTSLPDGSGQKANQAITVIRYGKQASVMAGVNAGGNGPAPAGLEDASFASQAAATPMVTVDTAAPVVTLQ